MKCTTNQPSKSDLEVTKAGHFSKALKSFFVEGDLAFSRRMTPCSQSNGSSSVVPNSSDTMIEVRFVCFFPLKKEIPMSITKRDLKKGDRVQLGNKPWNRRDPNSKTLLQSEALFAKQYTNRNNLFTPTLLYY